MTGAPAGGWRSYEVKEFLGVSGLTDHGKAGALAPLGSTSRCLSACPSLRKRSGWAYAVGGHMWHSSGGKPPCAAA